MLRHAKKRNAILKRNVTVFSVLKSLAHWADSEYLGIQHSSGFIGLRIGWVTWWNPVLKTHWRAHSSVTWCLPVCGWSYGFGPLYPWSKTNKQTNQKKSNLFVVEFRLHFGYSLNPGIFFFAPNNSIYDRIEASRLQMSRAPVLPRGSYVNSVLFRLLLRIKAMRPSGISWVAVSAVPHSAKGNACLVISAQN